nr:FMN-binding protein [Blautia sp. OF11-22]
MENEDDETFFNRAKVVADRIVDGQKTDVDLVSGATYSSRGIQNAVKQALENAKKATNGETVPDNGTSSGGTTTIPEGKFPYEEGIYYGTGEGYLGDITTAVVIQDETIKAILVTESEDDEAFLKRAKQTAKDVVKNQTLEVDTVSGATYSSRGILAAIEEALKEAERVTEEKEKIQPRHRRKHQPRPKSRSQLRRQHQPRRKLRNKRSIRTANTQRLPSASRMKMKILPLISFL